MFPNARLGFGESGNSNDDDDTAAQKVLLLNRYYQLEIRGDDYVGGYFWWYYVEDCLPYTAKPLWRALRAGFEAEAASLRRWSLTPRSVRRDT
jgi:hypothetical protein